MEVATRDRDRAPRDDHPRALDDAPPDRVADDERHSTHRAVLADGGDAGSQHRLGVHGGPDEQELLALRRDVVAARAIPDARQVGMTVDQARQDGGIRVVVGRGVAPSGGRTSARRPMARIVRALSRTAASSSDGAPVPSNSRAAVEDRERRQLVCVDVFPP